MNNYYGSIPPNLDVQQCMNGGPGCSGPLAVVNLEVLAAQQSKLGYDLGCASSRIQQLERALKQKRESDGAFALAIQMEGKTGTIGRRGEPVILADFVISGATRTVFDSLLDKEPELELLFKGGIPPLRISERDYLDDKVLLERLSSHTRQQINRQLTRTKLATLFRDWISRDLKTQFIPLHGGWQTIENGVGLYEFRTIGDRFVAYQPKGGMEPSVGLTFPAEIEEQAREGILGLLEAWRSVGLLPMHYWLMVVVECTGFLFSLLDMLGYRIPLGVCFQVDHPAMEDLLVEWLGCYGEKEADMGAVDLAAELRRRKDDTILIVQSGSTALTKANCCAMISALSTGVISEKGKSMGLLQALPLTVVRGASQFAVSDQMLSISIPGVPSGREGREIQRSDKRKFLQGLAWYVQRNLGMFESCLSKGRENAFSLLLQDLSRDQLKTFGVLNGVVQVLANFLGDLGLNQEAEALCGSGAIELVRDSLEESMFSAASLEECADAFVAVVKTMIENSELKEVPLEEVDINYEVRPDDIFVTKDCYCFPEKTVVLVGERMFYSRPKIIRALDERGWLLGTQANSRTKLTRKILRGDDGARRTLYFFKLRRTLFCESNELFL